MKRPEGGRDTQQDAAAAPGAPSFKTPALASGLNFLTIWMLNATLVPGINESHYLPKAKHAWDPSFAPGDLFLSSGNAHWLFNETAGFMTTFLSLAAVTWLGRIVSWLCMAFAWQRCATKLNLPPVVAAFVLAGWMVATRLGNWAGEWAIGGFEAKSLAYPFVVLALAELISGKWPRVWMLTGVAIAFHPLVGGWAGVTFACAWLQFARHDSPLREQWIPGLVAVAISLVGVAPALMMIGGPARVGDIVVAQIHAYYRLAHHQSPHLFAPPQHVAGAVSFSLFVVSTLLVARFRPVPTSSAAEKSDSKQSSNVSAVGALFRVAWFSVGISVCGLLIDFVGEHVRPDLAASLLRFYWFRWSDVIVPLAWVCGAWTCALAVWEAGQVNESPSRSATRRNRWPSSLPMLLCGLATVGFVSSQVVKNWKAVVAPADETIMMKDNPRLAAGPEAVVDWQAMCAWAAEHTPSDALFFTPRAQQSFKWYAGRAEVVCFKDVPQDSQSLLEWYDRVGRCAPPRDAAQEPLGWTTAQLKRLQSRYNFQYVIVDRRIQRDPPLLEIVYPLGRAVNSTYAVFKLGDNRSSVRTRPH